MITKEDVTTLILNFQNDNELLTIEEYKSYLNRVNTVEFSSDISNETKYALLGWLKAENDETREAFYDILYKSIELEVYGVQKRKHDLMFSVNVLATSIVTKPEDCLCLLNSILEECVLSKTELTEKERNFISSCYHTRSIDSLLNMLSKHFNLQDIVMTYGKIHQELNIDY